MEQKDSSHLFTQESPIDDEEVNVEISSNKVQLSLLMNENTQMKLRQVYDSVIWRNACNDTVHYQIAKQR